MVILHPEFRPPTCMYFLVEAQILAPKAVRVNKKFFFKEPSCNKSNVYENHFRCYCKLS